MKTLIIIFTIWLVFAAAGVIAQIVLTLISDEKMDWEMIFKEAALWPVTALKAIGKVLKL